MLHPAPKVHIADLNIVDDIPAIMFTCGNYNFTETGGQYDILPLS
jgi:hypothetical protein